MPSYYFNCEYQTWAAPLYLGVLGLSKTLLPRRVTSGLLVLYEVMGWNRTNARDAWHTTQWTMKHGMDLRLIESRKTPSSRDRQGNLINVDDAFRNTGTLQIFGMVIRRDVVDPHPAGYQAKMKWRGASFNGFDRQMAVGRVTCDTSHRQGIRRRKCYYASVCSQNYRG